MIIIQKLQLKDIKDFTSLWNKGHRVLTSSRLLMTEEKAKSGFISKMFGYYGIYNDSKLIGFMLLKENDRELWIKHMLIDKDLRDKGMGKMLLDIAIKEAKQRGKKIKVEVLTSNKRALSFFIKYNFKTIVLRERESVLELT